MIIAEWYHIPTWLSLLVIALILTASIGFSISPSAGSTRSGRITMLRASDPVVPDGADRTADTPVEVPPHNDGD